MSDHPSALVCRGCCCGQAAGRPDPGAARRLDRLRALLRGSGIVVEVSRGCLGPCDHRDVVVLRPSRRARGRGARALWLGWVAGDDAVDDVADFLSRGGPGVAEVPDALHLHAFPAPGSVVDDGRRRTRGR